VDPSVCARANPVPGPQAIRRLNNREFDATIRDLLGDTSDPAREFVRPNLVAGFDTGADGLRVSPLLLEQIHDAAVRLADTAAANPSKVVPCASAGSVACADQFIRDFGARAFRRPLAPEDVARYRRVFDTGKAERDFAEGLKWVVQAMLESPSFLYRIEQGMPGEVSPGVTRPTHHEMAARLSYFLWGTMPDDELFKAAEAGKLGTAEDVAREARRLLASPRAATTRGAFFALWLGLDRLADVNKDPKAFPSFSEAVPPLWRAEMLAFTEAVAGAPEGTLAELLTAPYTYANGPLAKLYGLTQPRAASFERVALDPRQRAGLLTQSGLMGMLAHDIETSPIERGVFMLEKVLCQEIASPPPGLDVTPPMPDPRLSLRQRLDVLTGPAACAACHKVINALGYGFENYDAIGAYRSKEPNGAAIDARGAFDGAVALAQRLAQSRTVRECFARSWFRYANGRPENSGDACAIRMMVDELARSGDKVQALVLATTQSDPFLFRPSAGASR
jgi:hypothetical protein